MKRVIKIRDEGFEYKEVIMNKELLPACWMSAPSRMEKVENDRKKLIQQEKEKRFWRPICIYAFGPGGSGKSGLFTELFRDEMYDEKPKKQRNNWWNGYDEQEIVLLDEFYTKIDWNDLVNILNDTPF
ncbi:4840_t:CDS:1 [Scutellospora calospora]|uniref:4840_t:CDS:1 n=1 Tax=Scutellospora calospora TaxID=85575 RepID=A0ACA9LLK2_9GLOM|nr:4840_t:CDS:1 [Scutellospora calospora]